MATDVGRSPCTEYVILWIIHGSIWLLYFNWLMFLLSFLCFWCLCCRYFCNAAVTNRAAYSAVVPELLLKKFCCCWASLESNSVREGCADCRSIPGDPQRWGRGRGAVPEVLPEYWLESFSSYLLLSSYTCFLRKLYGDPKRRHTEAEFLDETQKKVLIVLLLANKSHLYSFALRFLFLQLTQPLTVSIVCYCTLYRRQEENLIENHTSFPMV